MLLCPLYVPLEILPAGKPDPSVPRTFRLALAISAEALRLRSPLPEELCGPVLQVRFHLPPATSAAYEEETDAPSAPGPLSLRGRAAELIIDEGDQDEVPERSAFQQITFVDVSPATRARIHAYIERRLQS